MLYLTASLLALWIEITIEKRIHVHVHLLPKFSIQCYHEIVLCPPSFRFIREEYWFWTTNKKIRLHSHVYQNWRFIFEWKFSRPTMSFASILFVDFDYFGHRCLCSYRTWWEKNNLLSDILPIKLTFLRYLSTSFPSFGFIWGQIPGTPPHLSLCISWNA